MYFVFIIFFKIPAIVCMYSKYVRVYLKKNMYVHFILSFKTGCNFHFRLNNEKAVLKIMDI